MGKDIIDWGKIDTMIETIQDSQTKGQPVNNQNPDEVPVRFLDTKEIKGAEADLTIKIVLVKNTPVFKIGFHYPLTNYLKDNQKFVCNSQTIDLDSNGDPCVPCQLMESKRFQKLRTLAWNIRENRDGMLDNYDTATKEFMMTQSKDILNFRPVVFYYITFVKVPYDGSLYIFRSFEQEAMKILTGMRASREKGAKLFDWKKGYNMVLTLERKGSSPYMGVKGAEFTDKTSVLTKDKDAVKKLELFLKDFNIFNRMKITTIDTEDQKALTKKWLKLKEESMKRCGYVWDRDDEKYDFIGAPTVEESEDDKPPFDKDEPKEEFDVDQVLGELDDLELD